MYSPILPSVAYFGVKVRERGEIFEFYSLFNSFAIETRVRLEKLKIFYFDKNIYCKNIYIYNNKK